MMADETFKLEIYDTAGTFIRGGWDGGYSPGEEFVGVGWKVWIAEDVICVEDEVPQPKWRICACGYGRFRSQGSTFLEMMAFGGVGNEILG